jgi:hypothetical protein
LENEESQTEHHSILGFRGIEMLGKSSHSEHAITSISNYVGGVFRRTSVYESSL